MSEKRTRMPAVAGQFYPDDPKRLREMTREFIERAEVEAMPGRAVALVVPHAGYVYSGRTAGFAYARVRGKRPKRVILTGCGHREHVRKASVFSHGMFRTLVGTFPVDEAFAGDLMNAIGSESDSPHLLEHSLEVQLPFLEALFGEVPIVPVLFGGPVSTLHAEIGEAIAARMDADDLLIASTDLSHYLAQERANEIDRRTLETVLSQNGNAFLSGIASGALAMCGAAAVAAGMACALAREATDWVLLDYRTSGESSGDYRRVVGYAAISMEAPE